MEEVKINNETTKLCDKAYKIVNISVSAIFVIVLIMGISLVVGYNKHDTTIIKILLPFTIIIPMIMYFYVLRIKKRIIKLKEGK